MDPVTDIHDRWIPEDTLSEYIACACVNGSHKIYVIGHIHQNRNHPSFVESTPHQLHHATTRHATGEGVRKGSVLTVIPFPRVLIPALGATWEGFGADASDTYRR